MDGSSFSRELGPFSRKYGRWQSVLDAREQVTAMSAMEVGVNTKLVVMWSSPVASPAKAAAGATCATGPAEIDVALLAPGEKFLGTKGQTAKTVPRFVWSLGRRTLKGL